MVGPPPVGLGNDVQEENEQDLNLPKKVAREVEVFQFDGNGVNGNYSEDNNVNLVLNAKKTKNKTKQKKTKQKKHIKTRAASSSNHNKDTQIPSLQEQNDLVNATMWSLFEKCISNMVQLLAEKTNDRSSHPEVFLRNYAPNLQENTHADFNKVLFTFSSEHLWTTAAVMGMQVLIRTKKRLILRQMK